MAKVTLTFEDLPNGTVNFVTESDPVPDLEAGIDALSPAQGAALMTAMYVQTKVFVDKIEQTEESNDE